MVAAPSASNPSPICVLPNELLMQILQYCSLCAALSLSSTCRLLRALVNDPLCINHLLRDAMYHGELRWILPVPLLLDEAERTCNAMSLWLRDHVDTLPSAYSRNTKTADTNSADHVAAEKVDDFCQKSTQVRSMLLDEQFPCLEFVRACCTSDSMMNRRRISRVVKQIEGRWRDYRLRGCDVDRFFPSETILDRLQAGVPECRPACEL